MQEKLTLDVEEQAGLQILNEAEWGGLKVRGVGEVMGLSERQVWRLRAAYRAEGAEGRRTGTGGGSRTTGLMLEQRRE